MNPQDADKGDSNHAETPEAQTANDRGAAQAANGPVSRETGTNRNPVVSEPGGTYSKAQRNDYDTDLFGNPVPDPGRKNSDARRTRNGSDRRHSAVPGIPSDQDIPGTYATRTELIRENTRSLGASQVNIPEEAAQALAYLGNSAVERFDALITDRNGKPLAIVGAFKGELKSAPIPLSVIVAEAFRVPGATNIWFAHNHPSGKAEFSGADRRMAWELREAFRGSGITAHGLFAIAGTTGSREFVFTDGSSVTGRDLDNARGSVSPGNGKASVPVMERILTQTGKLGPEVTSPELAKEAVRNIAGNENGVILLDVQNAPVAFLPIDPKITGELRRDGRMDALYRAISLSNAGAAIIANKGMSVEETRNLAGLFRSSDIRVLDVMEDDKSWAAAGRDFDRNTFYQAGRTPLSAPLSTPAQLRESLGKRLGAKILAALEKAGFSGFTPRSPRCARRWADNAMRRSPNCPRPKRSPSAIPSAPMAVGKPTTGRSRPGGRSSTTGSGYRSGRRNSRGGSGIGKRRGTRRF
jgi:hypothetical protein